VWYRVVEIDCVELKREEYMETAWIHPETQGVLLAKVRIIGI
jgi:hypothetical protein